MVISPEKLRFRYLLTSPLTEQKIVIADRSFQQQVENVVAAEAEEDVVPAVAVKDAAEIAENRDHQQNKFKE